jgi:3-hydroxybutyryl-CoA dehydrogenase
VSGREGYARPAIAGSGTIATGLAACASALGQVRLLARSDASAWRGEERAHAACGRLEAAEPGRIRVTTEPADLADSDLVIEAIVEDAEAKAAHLRELASAAPDADLATTTSSLSIAELGERSGTSGRLFGLHVFNPVERMELVELCLPDGLRDGARERAHSWCRAIEKRPVEVPDQPGFVVNRLLFPYLFDAVRLLEGTEMEAAAIDECMTYGAGHPMGPLRVLDLVGLDVAVAIGDALHAGSGEAAHRPPDRLRALIDEGRLGRKSGRGFYDYGR